MNELHELVGEWIMRTDLTVYGMDDYDRRWMHDGWAVRDERDDRERWESLLEVLAQRLDRQQIRAIREEVEEAYEELYPFVPPEEEHEMFELVA